MALLGHQVPLTHAYEIVASNYGFPNWATMRSTIEKAPRRKARQLTASMPDNAAAALRALLSDLQHHIDTNTGLGPAALPPIAETLANLVTPVAENKIVWTSTLEEAYVGLCQWVLDFQFQTRVLSKLTAQDGVTEDVAAFTEILDEGSFKLVEVEQALTILHGIAVEGR
jgi:hypothetical protein